MLWKVGNPLLTKFDETLRDDLGVSMNVQLTDDQRIQASLPVYNAAGLWDFVVHVPYAVRCMLTPLVSAAETPEFK